MPSEKVSGVSSMRIPSESDQRSEGKPIAIPI
jgi:hypothetical protein